MYKFLPFVLALFVSNIAFAQGDNGFVPLDGEGDAFVVPYDPTAYEVTNTEPEWLPDALIEGECEWQLVGTVKNCADHGAANDPCTMKEKGKVCKTEKLTCSMPGGGHGGAHGSGSDLTSRSCCDFGEDGTSACGCNKKIEAPGKCKNDPKLCLTCMTLAELGDSADGEGNKNCAACIKASMDERMQDSNGKMKNYCEVTTSTFGNNFAYTPAGVCICNTKPRAGASGTGNKKFCDCCSGKKGDWTDAQRRAVEAGLNGTCPSNDVDAYTSDNSVPKRMKADGSSEPCPEVQVKGCKAMRFFNCQ